VVKLQKNLLTNTPAPADDLGRTLTRRKSENTNALTNRSIVNVLVDQENSQVTVWPSLKKTQTASQGIGTEDFVDENNYMF